MTIGEVKNNVYQKSIKMINYALSSFMGRNYNIIIENVDIDMSGAKNDSTVESVFINMKIDFSNTEGALSIDEICHELQYQEKSILSVLNGKYKIGPDGLFTQRENLEYTVVGPMVENMIINIDTFEVDWSIQLVVIREYLTS